VLAGAIVVIEREAAHEVTDSATLEGRWLSASLIEDMGSSFRPL